MQQVLYNPFHANSIDPGRADATAGSAVRGAGLLRWIARRWDLIGVLALMVSSATYAVFSLTHLV